MLDEMEMESWRMEEEAMYSILRLQRKARLSTRAFTQRDIIGVL
jgi:hypothetical protein